LIHCGDTVFEGDEIVLSFRAPNRGPYIDATARVRRVFMKRGRPVAGTDFTDIGERERQELRVRLAGFPPPVPMMRRRMDYAETIRRIAGTDAF